MAQAIITSHHGFKQLNETKKITLQNHQFRNDDNLQKVITL